MLGIGRGVWILSDIRELSFCCPCGPCSEIDCQKNENRRSQCIGLDDNIHKSIKQTNINKFRVTKRYYSKLNHVIAKEVKRCTHCCYFKCATLIVWVGWMLFPKTGVNHAKFGLSDKGRAIKELVVCKGWNLELLALINRLLSTVPWGMNHISKIHDA